ncbi:MAG TPA: Si-specific NAD(P)(+) transhydrogenase [Candidatus Binataceae bacterium]|nr:Si-specific NAD(P)(+) transhydrogenase [Candidatus Binataceae bacterium]
MLEFEYDLAVVGSGPAGHRAAIQAAKLRKRVIVIERNPILGGVCINTGTIPSKTLREAVLYLSGYREHSMYGASYRVKERITLADLLFRIEGVVRHEIDVSRHQLQRNGVEIACGSASFQDPHTLLVSSPEGNRLVSAAHIVLAVGTHPAKDKSMPLDGVNVFTSDDILQLTDLPRSLAVIGAGVIGCEYASMFAQLDVQVTLIDSRPRLLPFVDREISDTLAFHLREKRVTLRLGEKVEGVEVIRSNGLNRVRVNLGSGKQIMTDKVLSSMGREGSTTSLNLESVGINPDNRGRLTVNEHFQTSVPHIYAAGDVIGFPSLASTSAEQGRIAACHAFGIPAVHAPELLPYGIYTIPELSFVGRNEEELTEQDIPYEIGKARYDEIARGKIVGDSLGLLKLVFHRETHELLGVHALGEGACELVHIGQAVLSLGGKVDYFIGTVFNYPTLAECYKTAAFDGINRLA